MMNARRFSGKRSVFLCSTLIAAGCGLIIDEDIKKYDDAHGGALSAEKEETTANLQPEDSTAIIPIKCKVEKKDLAYANGVVQTLFGRTLNAEENALVGGGLDREKFVDDALANSESTYGITKFVSNLFLLNNIRVPDDIDDDDIAVEAQLVADLQKEPVQLVLRNIDKPWEWFFTTKDFFCTKNTAPIYGFPEQDSGAFVSCKMPQDRAGFLGLASVLRANPSSMISTNNNYHRVAFALYLSQGFLLLDATNGPTGDGKGIPMPACAPITDFRVAQSGLVYGAASIPAVGSTCASCHSPYNAVMQVAFRRFDERGETYTFSAVDDINGNVFTELGTNRDEIKRLLNEQESCWSPDGVAPPRKFIGNPGLGRLIAESGTLGEALGVQIPQMLGNVNTDPNMASTIRKTYEENGHTLKSAIKGYLVSDSFQCAVKEDSTN